ncbi:MAG TPA: FAD-dependent oxidoreductase [Firmicutes bacterium]|nr:FAD-dependent oxidoreductase [Bacillota bacterium]
MIRSDSDTVREVLDTPIRGEYDVIVCGGGVAGAAAAAAAAREDARVLLIEKSVVLGGLAVNGLISYYEPICTGTGKKLMTGMAEELFRLAICYGPDTLPDEWKGLPEEAAGEARCASVFSPALFAMALDKWLLDAGVELLLDTWVVQALGERDEVRGVLVENKTGRGAYLSKAVIDATGDADLFFRKGLPCVTGTNYLSYIAYVTDWKQMQEGMESGNLLKARRWVNAGSDLWGRGHPEGYPQMSGVTAEEVTKFVLDGRAALFERVSGQERLSRDVTVLPTMAQLRTTRRIQGRYTLTEADCGRHFADSIGVATDFHHRDRLYELPAGILFHDDCPNLFTAGRTVSADGWAWHVTRVIPVAVATGQAAGVMAALKAKEGVEANETGMVRIQKALKRQGVRLHIE